MLRLPGFVVHLIPSPLESIVVTAPRPIFRLFQVDCRNTSIECSLHANTEKLSVIDSWGHVVDVATMADDLSITVGLSFVDMVDSIKPAVEIILVFTPSNARHHVDFVATFAPCIYPSGHVLSDAINDGNVTSDVQSVGVRRAGLKYSSFRIGWNRDLLLAKSVATCKESSDDHMDNLPETKRFDARGTAYKFERVIKN